MHAPGFITLGSCAAVALVLVVIATPEGVFQEINGTNCITLWGRKEDCNSNNYVCKTNDCGTCSEFTQRMNAAAAFAIISIASLLLTLGMTLLGLTKRLPSMKLISAVFGLGTASFLIIVFALEGSLYNQLLCGVSIRNTAVYQYGAGFGLTVTAFCVVLIGSVLQLSLRADFTD
jgi:hypothetical protein